MKPKRQSDDHTALLSLFRKVLQADPAAVRADMEELQRAHAAERASQGQRKRGRKPKTSALVSDPASRDKG